MLGRHRKALAKLGDLFKQGKIGKTYWAVVEGGPEEDEGLIDLPLGRLDETRGWWMKVDPAGQPRTQTRWTVLGGRPSGKHAGSRWSPLTGRTHQLRVHCAAMGWPILGDAIYGNAPRFGGPILHLHVARDRGAALQEPRSGPRDSAGAAAYARGARGLRMEAGG